MRDPGRTGRAPTSGSRCHARSGFDAGYPRSERIDCATGSTLDDVEQTVTAGESSLSYNPGDDRYTYVWKTEKAWAGTCRRLVVGLNDGSKHTADFALR